MFSWLVLNIVFDCCIIDNLSGATLANGGGGREKTHKIKLNNKNFWQKSVIFCLQTNLAIWFKRSFVQNTADKAL